MQTERQDAYASYKASRLVRLIGGSATSDDSRTHDKTLLGVNGPNIVETADIGLTDAPGFNITTEACARDLKEGSDFSGLRAEVAETLGHIERAVGKRYGDAADPLLVSVRSGARVSMPSMMDTVLNLGLNEETVKGLAAASGDCPSDRRLLGNQELAQ